MKKILLAAMSIVLMTTALTAQQVQSTEVNGEHLIMKDDKIYHNMNVKEMLMGNQMTFHNGTIMQTNGSYQLKNGKQRQLRNGHCMDMNGKKYRSHQMFQKSMMRMHGSKIHSGGHQGMNMNGHH